MGVITTQVSFDVYNEQAVEKIQNENPDLLPTYSVGSSEDLEYNKDQVNSTIEAAIENGDSIDTISENLADRLESVNESSAVRTARTAATCALNSGTLESFYEAKALGIKIQKQWISTLDSRTRPSHQEADREIRDLDAEFSTGLQYPGDPSGDPEEIYNCRCTMVAFFPGIDDEDEEVERWSRNTETGEREYVTMSATKGLGGEYDYAKSTLTDRFGAKGVEYHEVQKLDEPMKNWEEIAQKIGGWDTTEGSCASCALAAVGNYAGDDVTDLRGGDSQEVMCWGGWEDIGDWDEIGTVLTGQGGDTYENAQKVLDSMEVGHVYYACMAMHCAIIKCDCLGGDEDCKIWYYLEMQSGVKSENGWHRFFTVDNYTLDDRFGATKEITLNGRTATGKDRTAYAYDVDNMVKCDELHGACGMINTRGWDQDTNKKVYDTMEEWAEACRKAKKEMAKP